MTNIAVVLPDSYSKVIVIFSISMRPCICEEVYSEILNYLSKTPTQRDTPVDFTSLVILHRH